MWVSDLLVTQLAWVLVLHSAGTESPSMAILPRPVVELGILSSTNFQWEGWMICAQKVKASWEGMCLWGRG